MPNHFKKRRAQFSVFNTEGMPKCSIHDPDSTFVIHHDQSIKHRTENRLHAEFTLSKAFFELPLPIDQRFKRKSNLSRLLISADEELSRRTPIDDGVG